MTKSTKIIAALGVIAGLGVAALPIGAFAASTQEVTVKVNIDSSISLGVDQAMTQVTMAPNQANTTSLKTKLTVACSPPSRTRATNSKSRTKTLTPVSRAEQTPFQPLLPLLLAPLHGTSKVATKSSKVVPLLPPPIN